MLLAPRKNGLDSLFKEVTGFSRTLIEIFRKKFCQLGMFLVGFFLICFFWGGGWGVGSFGCTCLPRTFLIEWAQAKNSLGGKGKGQKTTPEFWQKSCWTTFFLPQSRWGRPRGKLWQKKLRTRRPPYRPPLFNHLESDQKEQATKWPTSRYLSPFCLFLAYFRGLQCFSVL